MVKGELKIKVINSKNVNDVFINGCSYKEFVKYIKEQRDILNPGDNICLSFINMKKIELFIKEGNTEYVELFNYILDHHKEFSVNFDDKYKYMFTIEEVINVLSEFGFFHFEEINKDIFNKSGIITISACKKMYNNQLTENCIHTNLFNFIDKIEDSDKKILVEIGAYTGESTKIFSKKFNTVIVIDPYENLHENDSINTSSDMEIVENIFKDYIKKIDNITHHKMRSCDIVEDFENESIDVVYINYLHNYDDIEKNIIKWSEKVKKDGIISGHDYDCERIKKIVDKLFEKVELSLDGSNWWVKK